MKTLPGTIFLLLLLSSLACHQSAVPDDAPPLPEISPYLFGQNLWLTAGAEGRTGYIQDHLWPKVQESGVTMVRIGGHGYDVSLPGLDVLETWVRSIKEIGAEPLFQVPRYEPLEKAVELVRYFNKEKDYGIKYWSIGNEPYHLGKLSIDSISSYIKLFASAMKEVDPEIKIFVPDAAAYYEDLHRALLIDDRTSVAGRDEHGRCYIDGVAFHNYPNARDYTRSDVIFFSVSKMRGMIMKLVDDIREADQKYDRRGEDRLLWGLTEFNITYHNPDDHSVEGVAVPSFINGQFWAEIFALAMEYDAFTVTPWCIQESDRKRTYFGYVGGPPEFLPHSTYYHMQMMSRGFAGSFVKMTSNDPYVKVMGACSDQGTTVMLMNQDLNRVLGYDLDQLNEKNGEGGLEIHSAVPLKISHAGSLAPNSTLMLRFDQAGKLLEETLYNLDMARENRPPDSGNSYQQ